MTKTFNERFDEKYNSVTSCKDDVCDECHNGDNCYIVEDIKQFIQDEIGEVLGEIDDILPSYVGVLNSNENRRWYEDGWIESKEEAKQIINKRFNNS